MSAETQLRTLIYSTNLIEAPPPHFNEEEEPLLPCLPKLLKAPPPHFIMPEGV